MGKTHLLLYTRLLIAICMMAMGGAVWAGTRTDVLTPAAIGSFSSYTSWSGKTFESTAVYAGMTNGSLYISIKQTYNNSGIVTTTSGGKARNVTVSWGNMKTDKERVINIYGKNSKYSTPTDLFSTTKSTQGTLLGTLKYGTSTSLTISGEYAYIGIRVEGDYTVSLSQIEIEWEDASYDPPKTITTTSFPQSTYSVLLNEAFEAPEATVSANGATLSEAVLSYTSSDPSVATVDASTGVVSILKAGTTTITASFAGNDTFKESAGNYTLTIRDFLSSIWQSMSLPYAKETPVGTVTEEDDIVGITFAQGKGNNGPAYHLSSTAKEDKTILFDRDNTLTLAAKEGYAVSGITIRYWSGNYVFTPSIGSYGVKESANDWIGTWTGCSPHVTLTNTSGIRLFIHSITANYIKLAEAGTVTVSSAGVATYCYCPINQRVVVGNGTLTNIITGVENGVVKEENIPIVPSGTGVMLHGAGTYKCYTDSRLTEPTIATNYLVGETDGGYVPVGSYALQNQEGEGLGFYPVQTVEHTPIGAGKAYLTLPKELQANLRPLFFTQDDADRSTTGLQPTRFDSHSATTFYNLNGLPLKAPQKGINIIRKADGTIRKMVTP